MKKRPQSVDWKVCSMFLIVAVFFLLFVRPNTSIAVDYSQLEGYWECLEEGVPISLEFESRQQLRYNGEAYSYQLASGTIQVREEEGLVEYFFALDGDNLIIFSPDGSVMQCQKGKKPKPAEASKGPGMPEVQNQQIESSDESWPPPYARPQGNVDENNPGNQALLYKFAGRWYHATTNTLTNILLKPDGTYEEDYEAVYSGEFKDEGGYQTGNWNATGMQRATGRWKVVGGLRHGKLYLVDKNGKEIVYTYQVHIKGGEVFWGEYFFDDKLYGVEYIYR